MLIERMMKTINRHNLIKNGDKIVVGLSGGADSVALLHALLSISKKFNLNIVACHVNHKIRTDTAERDQKFVEELCKSLGVECYVKEVHVEALAKKWGICTEEAGRRVRYAFFDEIAGCDGKIATAHHMNDNAETVVMRFLRGTGLHGLSGIPYQRNNIIRPLLDVSRKDIELFLTDEGYSHITDESNLIPVYTRNKIRLNLIPEIQRDFNPNFVETLANNISVYRDEDDFMTESALKIIPLYFTASENRISISKSVIQKEHIAIIRRAVAIFLKNTFGFEPSLQAINSIVELLNKHSGASFDICNELTVISNYENVVIFTKVVVQRNMSEFCINLSENGVIYVDDMIINHSQVSAVNVENNPSVFYLPASYAEKYMVIRTRREGDVLNVAPSIRKKLKKFFIDEKIPSYERDKYWVLANQKNEVLWIPKLFGGRLDESERKGDFVKFEILQNSESN